MTFKKIMHVLFAFWVVIFAAFAVSDNGYSSNHGFIFLTVIGIVAFLFSRTRRDRSAKTKDNFETPMGKQMAAHYKQAGLSDSEVDVFRETMAEAKKQIVALDETMAAVPKLRAINLNHDTVDLSKAMFAALVKEPDRLQEAAPFLYKHLPTSLQIAKKYAEISHHEIKTSDTYQVLDRSVEMLAALSEQIKHDYLDFVAEDVDSLQSTLDSVNEKHDQPDFSGQSDQTIAQMQAELNQIQQDYLQKNADEGTPTDIKSATDDKSAADTTAAVDADESTTQSAADNTTATTGKPTTTAPAADPAEQSNAESEEDHDTK